MGWTPLILKTDKLKVFILGSGEVGERRASRFIDSGAEVIISGGTVSEDLKNRGAIVKPVEKIEKSVQWADLVVLASGDKYMNEKVANLAGEKLLNRADYPLEGNIIVPTTFSVGDAQVSIFTGGKSPLMASMLRKKIQAAITREDILQIELQDYAREKLKSIVDNQRSRREYLYKFANNPEIIKCLKEDRLDDAIDIVNQTIVSLSISNPNSQNKIKSSSNSHEESPEDHAAINKESPENSENKRPNYKRRS